MEFPNWFKVVWWLALTAALSALLGYFRFDALAGGEATAFDIVAFAIWVALLLAPLFQEVDIFGVKLKQQLDQLASQIRTEITGLRSEIQSTNSLQANVNPHIYLSGSPPTDTQLNSERAQLYLRDIARSYGVTVPEGEIDVSISDEADYLFRVRFNLELELRGLWRERIEQEERYFSVRRVVDTLVGAEILNPELAHVIREVYAICSAAVHGRDVSDRQMRFVRATTPDLITSLRAISMAEEHS